MQVPASEGHDMAAPRVRTLGSEGGIGKSYGHRPLFDLPFQTARAATGAESAARVRADLAFLQGSRFRCSQPLCGACFCECRNHDASNSLMLVRVWTLRGTRRDTGAGKNSGGVLGGVDICDFGGI